MKIRHNNIEGIVYDTSSGLKFPDYDGTQSCAGSDTNYFYEINEGAEGHSPFLKYKTDAKSREQFQFLTRICATCPFLKECFGYAVKHESQGFWGGTSPEQRHRLRKEYNIILDEIDVSDYVEVVRNMDSKKEEREDNLPIYSVVLEVNVDAEDLTAAYDAVNDMVNEMGGNVKLSKEMERALFEEMGIDIDD
jgi:hypothetical protein